MPNRTFFIDHESQQSIRSMTLPIRSHSDDVITRSRQTPLVQDQNTSEQEASRRRYARQLATTEKDRVRRRRTHRKRNQSESRSQDCGDVLKCLPSSDIPPNLSRAATDLHSSLQAFLPPWPTALTPLERFIVLGPNEDHWCIDSRSKSPQNGLQLGNQEFARQRIKLAIELAADTTLTRRRAALLGTADSSATHIVGDGETSWLNLEEDSVMSCSGGSCGAELEDISKTTKTTRV